MNPILNVVNLISYLYFCSIISIVSIGCLIRSKKFLIWGSVVLNIIALAGLFIILGNVNNMFPEQIEKDGIKYEKLKDFPITTGYTPINLQDTVYFDTKTINKLMNKN